MQNSIAPKKVSKVIFEYEDGGRSTIEGPEATLIQSRINSSGILAGINVTNVETLPIDQPSVLDESTIV